MLHQFIQGIMNFNPKNLHFWCRVLSFLFLLLLRSVALNSDGVFLLSFKYSILNDPLSVLENWNYDDETPCSWNGVNCAELGDPSTLDMWKVTSLALPSSQLLGSIPEDVGMIEHLRHLDLSNNMLNGSLPMSIFNDSELQVLSLANNIISGELPEFIGKSSSLQILNLSGNAFAGLVPENLTNLRNLSVVSLKSNYFSGRVPSGFNTVEVLDLSSNLLNGSLPIDFGGNSLNYLNLSYNKIAGTIPAEFAKQIPGDSTIDLSFNNLSGSIPESLALQNQKSELLAGNEDLCGKPLKKLCSIPSTLSNPPNITNTSSPAFAAMPKTIETNPSTNTTGSSEGTQNPNATPSGLKPAMIAGIVVGDIAGIGVLAMLVFFVYQIRNRRTLEPTTNSAKSEKKLEIATKQYSDVGKSSFPCFCLTIEEGTSEATSSDSDHENTKIDIATSSQNGNLQKEGALVTVDGETKLELETLLKASAYILGTGGASIVYKAVLEDGRAFAVRRIGECGIDKKKDFENQVRAIAKFRHQNLVKIRGFYWEDKEKLLICDYVPNGSLATTYHGKSGPSLNLPLEVRFKIAKGVARGIAFIHEKKQVHGNIRPSNILLNSEMEPIISDFGLDRLLLSSINQRASGSARQLVNQRTQLELPNIGARPFTPMGSSSANQLAYLAPESQHDIKSNPKWDVYSFGIVLLELLSGRLFSDRELEQWPASGSTEEEKNRVLRMTDVGIKSEMEGREDAMLACFKLGFSCASHVPQKRPSMKEALQILEKIPAAINSSRC